MAEFSSTFDNQEGNIKIPYTGSPGEESTFPVADCNCGDDRSTTVSVSDESSSVSVDVSIKQSGYREQFIPSDDDEGIMGSEGDLFLSVRDDVELLPVRCTVFNEVTIDLSDTSGIKALVDSAEEPVMVKVTNSVPSGAEEMAALMQHFKEGGDMYANSKKLYLDISGTGVQVVDGKNTEGFYAIAVGDMDAGAFEGSGLSRLVVTGDSGVADGAFKSCVNLKTVEIENSGISIGEGSFEGCTSLYSINLHNASSISELAFSGCVSLEGIFLSDGVSIGQKAFYGCKNLSSVTYFGMEEGGSVSQESFGVSGIDIINVAPFYNGDTFGGVPVRFMEVPDPIAAYDPTGHTNEDMAEYPVLTDLTGNGHDIALNNFAWSGMSGIGGYEPMNAWYSNNNAIFSYVTQKEDEISVRCVNPETEKANILFFRLQNNRIWNGNDIPIIAGEHGVIIFTSESTDDIISLSPFEEGLLEKELIQQKIDDGVEYLYAGSTTSIPENGIFTMKTKPLYPNALVSDGVDDYGICKNFPILTKDKGYTVCALRKIITNKGYVCSTAYEVGNGAFIFEGIGVNDTYSFGKVNNIILNPSLFTYQTSKSYNGKQITPGEAESTNRLLIFGGLLHNLSNIALYALEIYDRDLTPYQIEAVKKRLMDRYENPEDTTSDWYGVEWYTNQSPSRVMRIGNMNLHRTLPIQSGMYRCILNDNGEEVYKLDPNDSTKKEDGTPAVLDGTDGQVMVYIPVFYARFESKGYRRRVKLSDHYKPGFIRMGGCYVSAYEATVDRTISTLIKLASVVNTTDNFRGGNNNAEWDSTYRSLLGMPATSISLTNFRGYARNRNDGDTQWNCMDYTAYMAIYWLYVVEYADRNCQLDFNENLTSDGFRQGGLGAGVTNINSTKWDSFNGYYPFVPCGHTNSLGNKTGIVQFIMPFEYDAGGAANYAGAYDAGTPYTDGQFVSDSQELYECIADAAAGTALSDTTYFTHVPRTSTNVPSYRGIENIFGHIWKWTDGVHIKVQSEEAGGKSILYTSDNPANYQDTDYEGYEEKGYTARANGHVRDIIFGRNGDFYVSEDGATGGSATTYFSDYYYTNIPESGEALRGILLGGHAYSGSSAGLVYVYSSSGPAAASANVGSLLCYIPAAGA